MTLLMTNPSKFSCTKGFRRSAFCKWMWCSIILFFASVSHAQISVWPGDANNDGIANHLDILNIGSGFGRQGNPRDTVSIVWQQEQVQPWNITLPNAMNLGYADCSGNGFVSVEDAIAIEENYGDTNTNYQGVSYLSGTTGDPEVSIVIDQTGFMQGAQSFVTIYLETDVDSAYAVAFTFEYDTTLIKAATVVAEPHPQFGGGGRVPVYVQKNYRDDAYLEFGIARTNGKSFAGGIAVCNVEFIVEDNLIGKEHRDFLNAFRVTKIRLLNRQMVAIPVVGDTADAKLTSLDEKEIMPFSIYPVPASTWLNIDNYNNEKLVSIELIDLKGIIHTPLQTERDWSVSLNVADLPRGIYVMRIIAENGVLHHKIVIER